MATLRQLGRDWVKRNVEKEESKRVDDKEQTRWSDGVKAIPRANPADLLGLTNWLPLCSRRHHTTNTLLHEITAKLCIHARGLCYDETRFMARLTSARFTRNVYHSKNDTLAVI